MSRWKDGEYMHLYWDSDPPAVYVAGHVDAETFRREVESSGLDAHGLTPVHGYARLVPRRGRDYDMEIIDCERGPGAFRVTRADAGGAG